MNDQTQSSPALRVTEIFYSLQGESSRLGCPTVFIRLTGCPLRCGYCDTAYAFHGGQKMPLRDILESVKQYQTTYVCLTGGEPLAQPNALQLMRDLADAGYQVSLETSGALDISDVDARVMKVMDIKTPGSGEESRNLWDNLSFLNPQDQIKFVICNTEDYEWAKLQVEEKQLTRICEVFFSPSYQQISPRQLADWIVRDQSPIRFQVQLHKILWGEEPGR